MLHPESRKAHWNEVHRGHAVANPTWFQTVPTLSLDLIREVVTDHDRALAAPDIDGPERCSGLPMQRYDEQTLSHLLGEDFRLDAVVPEVHTTPAGRTQSFV